MSSNFNKNRLKKSQNRLIEGLLLSSIMASTSMTSIGAEVEPQAKETGTNKVVVTGSRIRKVDIDNLSPIFSINREEIDKYGYANVKDVIDNMTQNAGGTFDNSATFGFTPGASAVNFRGLGFGQTLTLIDGRRLPIYPIGINGTTNFVDLSSIPMAFVERIDVLTDGASAIYGSDAVSGVINIITRKDIEGISLNFRTSTTSDGGFETQRFNLLTGARNGDTQLDVILDYWHQEPLWAVDRDYADSDVANPRGRYSFGGASFLGLQTGDIYQDPNCGSSNDALEGLGIPDVALPIYSDDDTWCGYDRSLNRQLIAPQERISLMTRIHYEINDSLVFFSRLGVSRLNTSTQLEPNFYGSGLLTGFGSLVPNNGGLVQAGASNNPTNGSAFEEYGVFVRRLVEFGPRLTEIKNDAVNILGGLSGTFANGAYDWEVGFSYNKTELDIDSNNIHLSALNLAVENGLDLFRPIPANTVEFLSFDANQKAFSTNRLFDFSISGDLDIQLGNGPIRFALAFEQVNESYVDRPDSTILIGDGFDGSSAGSGEREHVGLGGELNFPFSETFDLNVALRWDDYKDDSDVDSAFSPRLALSYTPSKSFLARLSWGKSFRAPDMQRLFGQETLGFNDIVDPENNGRVIQSVQILTTSNIDLEEEHGVNINLGFVWQATEKLDFSMDIFDISLDEVVAAPSAQFAVNACSQFDLLCEYVIRDSLGTLNGNEAAIIITPINFAKQETQGIDFTANYQWQNSWGNWNTRLMTTWIRAFYFQAVEGIQKVESIDLGVFPEYRSNLLVDWQKESVGATLRVSYVDEIAGSFCVVCEDNEYIDSWLSWNANFRYSFTEYSRISLGVNNLTNEEPPTDPTQNNWPWYSNSASHYNAVGREFYLQLDTSF